VIEETYRALCIIDVYIYIYEAEMYDHYSRRIIDIFKGS